MKVKITPIAENAQMLEFNVELPETANTAIAPISTLTFNQRWAKVIDIDGHAQVTKFDIIHNVQYTNCKGEVKVATNTTPTLLVTTTSSAETATLAPVATNVVDIVIPNGVTIVNQQILNELPTSFSAKGNCAYSVFAVHIEPSPQPVS